MADLYTKIILYLNDNSKTWDKEKIKIVNKGSGDFIETWNIDGLVKPTDTQLDALDTQANTYEQNLITNRANNIASAKTKLEALGLTTEEIKETFGI